MNLYRFPFDGRNIERFEAVNQSNGNNGASGIDGTFKRPSLKIQDGISIPAPGPFRKNQKISSCFYFLSHLIDDLQRFLNIFPVNGNPSKKPDHLLHQNDAGRFSFYNNAKWLRTSLNNCQHINQALMIGK